MSSTTQSNKRVKGVSSIDRLSELPEPIITLILSFLKVDESAITAVLSRRWQHLWIRSPQLFFRQGSNLLVPEFVSRVHRTLLSRGKDHIQYLKVYFDYTKPFAPDVNAWAQFAVKNQVKRVTFFLNTENSDFYVLPQLMCTNYSSLVCLSIKGCTFSPQRTLIDWPFLTDLFIEGVEVQQHIIEKILSGSPVLSILILNKCWGFNSLEIKTRSLKKINIRDIRNFEHNGPLLEISAPYIKFLKVHLSSPERRKLRLTNIPSHVVASIEFVGCDVESVEVMNYTKELLGKIQHFKEVKLGVNYLEVLSTMVIKNGYQFPQSTSWTYLTVNTDKNELSDIHGILGLVKSSPNLQKLFIKGGIYVPEPYNFTCGNADLERELLHLKTVIIKDLVAPNLDVEPMLALARILLKRTPVLEKIVIYDKEIIKSSASSALDPSTILKTLLSYPRSSQKALIILR